jgi:mono/diheme cytochrome c family protein
MPTNRRFSVLSFSLGALAVAVTFAIVALLFIARGFSARQKPGLLETSVAGYALNTSFSSRERDLHSPMAASVESLTEARNHFADHCASCHANNGSGHATYGEGMNPSPPDMRLSATQNKTDGELYSIIQNGVRWSGMPAFGSPGNQDESTWKLVLFIRHLPTLSPDEEQAMQKSNPISPTELQERQEEDDFLHGASPNPKGSKR